ncbi:MAG: alpha/beta fold hydrolase [Gemmataceae bacterium]|nr:alpha/beta fold hydrolase [Gemmataceae bacterium]
MGRVTWASAVALLVVLGVGAEDAPKPPFYADKSKLLTYIDGEGKAQPIEKAADWAKRRDHMLENMQQVMGPLPPASGKVPLDMKVEQEVMVPGVIRKKITFGVEKDDRLSAYLFLPAELKGKAPAMLCLHPTNPRLGKGVVAGLGPLPNRGYALELAERGYVTLAPDYPNSGDYKIDAYAKGYASATMKAIWNHVRCVDLLQSLSEVDGDRIGVIGHSLGGHNSLFVAAFDPRLKVAVTSCGFNAFPKYMKGNLKGWSHQGYMPRIASVYDANPKKMPFDFPEVLGAIAPRPVFVNAPVNDDNFEVTGVKDCITAALPVYDLFGAKDKLVAVYPDALHDFPNAEREQAYQLVDRALRGK